MFRSLIFLFLPILIVFNVECKSSLTVLHAPKGILFRSNHPLPVSQLKDIFETVLSYTVEAGYDWRGVEIKNPFTASAECLLIFYLRGPVVLNFLNQTTLSLLEDDDISQVFSDVARDTEFRYPDVEKTLFEANVGSNNIDELSDGQIDNASHSTETFKDELNKLKNFINQVVVRKNKDGVPDVYWITLAKIAQHPLISENTDLLEANLKDISEKVSTMYDGKAFIGVITEDQESKIRFKRDTSSSSKSNDSLADLNVAPDYSEDFPVIFNIILWFSLALLFSLIAISMVIAGMDPGRDSIIYRMTSTRMKKDN